MSKVKLIEVKDCEPEVTSQVAAICDHCGELSVSDVRFVVSGIDMDELISRVNDELDIAKRRMERIIRGIEG